MISSSGGCMVLKTEDKRLVVIREANIIVFNINQYADHYLNLSIQYKILVHSNIMSGDATTRECLPFLLKNDSILKIVSNN